MCPITGVTEVRQRKVGFILMYNGDLQNCLMTTLHHVAPHKAGLMTALRGYIDTEMMAFLNERVAAEVQTALKQIQKIQAAAKEGKLDEVVRLLDEKFDYGLDPSKRTLPAQGS